MNTIGNMLELQGVSPDLSYFLRNIPKDKPLNFTTIREYIETGSGRFSEAEGLLLLLESIIKRYKGEPGW